MPDHPFRSASGVLLALIVLTTGCGNDDSAQDEPSKAASACREEWKDLRDDVDGRDRLTNPSALAQRWNAIATTIDYHVTSARASDCGGTLPVVDEAMTDLAAFGGRLAAYDMELRLTRARDAAEDQEGAASARVEAAMKTLAEKAPVATTEQEAGWQQARAVELSDTAAVAKAVKDLAFLSSESPGYRASTAALRTIAKANARG